MDEILFNTGSKLSEVVTAYPALLYSLPRFGIALGFGDKSVAAVCAESGVSPRFFLLVCNVCCFDGYEPSISEIKNADIGQLVPYLKKAHKFYMGNRLPHIANHLAAILSHMPKRVANAFNAFFAAYRREVEQHFGYEEQKVYPHIEQLLQGLKPDDFAINDFVDEHGSLQDKLSDMNQIIFKYLPADTTDGDNEAIDAIFDILQLSADLAKHSLIEEKVLVPYVTYLEKKLR